MGVLPRVILLPYLTTNGSVCVETDTFTHNDHDGYVQFSTNLTRRDNFLSGFGLQWCIRHIYQVYQRIYVYMYVCIYIWSEKKLSDICIKGWASYPLCVEYVKSFYFFDVIYHESYIMNSMCVWSWIKFKEFRPLVIKIRACILRVGVLPHVTLGRRMC